MTIISFDSDCPTLLSHLLQTTNQVELVSPPWFVVWKPRFVTWLCWDVFVVQIMECSVGVQSFDCPTRLQLYFMLWLEVGQLYVGYKDTVWLDYEHKHGDMTFILTEGILWEVSTEIQRSGCCREKTDGEPCVISRQSDLTAIKTCQWYYYITYPHRVQLPTLLC